MINYKCLYESKDELGNKIKSIIDKGLLAPDNIINKLYD